MKRRKCAECAFGFEAKQAKQVFCSPSCRTAYHNRMSKRGKTLTPLVMAYRVKRDSDTSKRAHFEYCRLVADFNEEDTKAGRMSAHAFMAHQYQHWLRP